MYRYDMSSTRADIAVAQRLKAIADETRIRILDHLGSDECCVCELTEALGIGQSLLSFHLKILKEAGLVTDRREGRWAYYVVEATAIRELAAIVDVIASPSSKPARKRRSCSEKR